MKSFQSVTWVFHHLNWEDWYSLLVGIHYCDFLHVRFYSSESYNISLTILYLGWRTTRGTLILPWAMVHLKGKTPLNLWTPHMVDVSTSFSVRLGHLSTPKPFLYFLLLSLFSSRHPTSRCLRYTGCWPFNCLEESLAPPPDLVSMEWWWEREWRRRTADPPVKETVEMD